MTVETEQTTLEATGDVALVRASQAGDPQAFGRIVSRYQRLLCSLAYASLGNLSESQDVAQEAFVEAWKKLGNLREPEKFKAWLCGILRFKIRHHRRREAREPARHGEGLREAEALESQHEPVEVAAMREEEQALLWRALETVPETYRETLVLFYREDRSVRNVARELDVSEDTVKQRLSRGRRLLQERTLEFVEGALERSAPGPVFSAGVLAALTTVGPPVRATGAGVTAAKAAGFFPWAAVVTFLATASGLISSVFAIRANLDQSRTPRERKAVVRTAAAFLGLSAVFVGGMVGLRLAAVEHPRIATPLAVAAQAWVLGSVAAHLGLTHRLLNGMRALRASERRRRPELFAAPEDQPGSRSREYRSRLRLFGVPLVHAKFAMAEEGDRPAVGWIAAGDRAFGLLFAWGGVAVAPVSVGILSVGLVSVGAVGFGLVGVGSVGIGLLAIGASAVGFKAFGSLSALGWESALSPGFSAARDAAVGAVAHAREVNTGLAASIADVATVDRTHVLVLGLMALLVIVPVALWSRAVRKRNRPGVGRTDGSLPGTGGGGS